MDNVILVHNNQLRHPFKANKQFLTVTSFRRPVYFGNAKKLQLSIEIQQHITHHNFDATRGNM